MLAEYRRRFPGYLAKDTVKMGQGLEPDGVGDLTDTEMRIQEEVLCFLHSDAPEIVGKSYPDCLFEDFAKYGPFLINFVIQK